MKTPFLSRIYFPGLISLVFLPVMCIGYFMYQYEFSKISGMEVAFADDYFFKRMEFNVEDFEVHSTKLEISGDAKSNNRVLSKLKVLCNGVVRKKQFGAGVTVVIKNDARYQDFINLIDVGFITKVSFTPYQNKVLYTLFKPIKAVRVPHPIRDHSVIIYSQTELSFTENILKFWPSCIIFVLMIVFAIRKKSHRQPAHQ